MSFFLGITGIWLLSDPLHNLKGMDDLIGISLALLAAIVFNFGFIAVRRVKKEIHSWQIVFYFMLINNILGPVCLFFENHKLQRNQYFNLYDYQALSLTFLIGLMTLAGNFCINKTLQHEKAGRATSYYSLELVYAFVFDLMVT